MKLPDMSRSPFFLVISSDSPVSRDSFTCTSPALTSASAQTWLPALKMTISSSTSSSALTTEVLPFRTTEALGAFNMVRLSRTCLARTSWIIPIRVLAMMTGRKVKSRKDPTIQSRTASTTKIKLKYVKTLSCMISFVVLDGGSTALLVQPWSLCSCTCWLVSPVL